MATVITNLTNLPSGWSIVAGANVTVERNRVIFGEGNHTITFRNNVNTMIKAGTFIKLNINITACEPRINMYVEPQDHFNLVDLQGDWTPDPLGDTVPGAYTTATGLSIFTFECLQDTPVDPDASVFQLHIYPAGQDGATSITAWGHLDFGYLSTGGESQDPYENGGASYPGGGDGNFDFSSTDIPIPGLPTISASDTGFISLYNPGAAGLKALASYMWSGAFDIENFRKLFADPMDAILGLHIIPIITGHPASVPSQLYVGNISTGISMPRCTEQYYELDCGTIQIPAKWGAYLDYSPYTKLSLFLPYIGFVGLSPDDCMKGSIRVVYHVDILSGSICAFVYCVSYNPVTNNFDGHTLYTFTGSCACDCPVTSGQYTNALFGIMDIAANTAGAIAAGSAGSVAGVLGGVSNIASTAISMAKPDISRSGSFGGAAGLMGKQYPYLVLTVPAMCTPTEQNKYIGYPSFITKTMADVSGYTEIDVSHLENMSCTEDEASEIQQLLAGGVIF